MDQSISAPVQEETPTPRAPVTRRSDSTHSDARTCWVCFATDEDDTSAQWVQPCNCRGTTKWVIITL